MSIFQKIFLVILLPTALVGCTEKITYTYLMQHPNQLKQAIVTCQAKNERTKDQASQCEMVMYAAANMLAIISQQQEEPEKFGQRLMDAEVAYVKATDELQVAQEALADLQNKKASPTDLTAATDKMDKARKTVEEKNEEIKVMLAVLGLSSPD